MVACQGRDGAVTPRGSRAVPVAPIAAALPLRIVLKGPVAMAAAEQDLLEDKIQGLRRRDRRFSRNAYYFVLDALDWTIAELGRDEKAGEERHVGGRELLIGIKEYASLQFGPMAPLVFERWGVRRSADFGEVVFNLVDAELLSRRATDSRLDFVDASDFRETFAQKHRESLDRIAQR
ncbi:MAG: hypothetical protein FJ306_07800 [Planctomycetes bacterium]|nr:hypothetical protein [Planctomycetota bacterium]